MILSSIEDTGPVIGVFLVMRRQEGYIPIIISSKRFSCHAP